MNDGGTLRLVYRAFTTAHPNYELREAVLGSKDGAPVWSAAPNAMKASATWPAAAAFRGTTHVVAQNCYNDLVHFVRGADGTWAAARANGAAVKTPDRGDSLGPSSRGMHDGKLHLVRGTMFDTRLWHAVFDGTAWSEGTLLPETHVSTHPPALASYDGRLHAVYTTPEGGLRHTTWTTEDGWARDVEGRESQELPALLTFKHGPAGAEREALLLVNRGPWRYVAPDRPEPATRDDVASTGTPVAGEYRSDLGAEGWSRITHRVLLTPATLKNGRTAAIATWEARAAYYWGFGYYPENYGPPYHASVSGILRFTRADGSGAGHQVDFSGGFDSDGRFRHDALVPNIDPGDYTLYVSTSNTDKKGGYWHIFRADAPDADGWARIDRLSGATVTATV
ncbi:hypothetical protein [Embleya scabrispora]|uniref:hypothetical protein n=1 Tax=Embleya scabrispora TaxID=159449 RepID=UPI0003644772|nr:hypothetical protein [Embleya scabrispora]MYS80775.1 hypothetical protein [Streptomyces sp. SID5474]